MNTPVVNKCGAAALMAMLFVAMAPPCADAQSDVDVFVPATRTTSTRDAIADALASQPADEQNSASIGAGISAFYEARDFWPVWSGDAEAASRVALVIRAFQHADAQGLPGQDYLARLPRKHSPQPGSEAAAFDIAMTGALFRYAHDLRLGRVDPSTVFKDVALPRRSFNIAAALGRALAGGGLEEFFDDLEPPQPGYRALAAALTHYRAIAAAGGWPVVPAGIVTDGNDSRIHVLAVRLGAEDPDLAATPDPDADDVWQALVKYQRRNGLQADGTLGPDTLKALNIPVSVRIRQIVANLERWRWMPDTFADRYVRVNVPDQSLDYIEDGQILLHSKVVVGRKNAQTPILMTAVVGIVVNPPWDIPDDIAERKYLRQLQRKPDYLASQKLVIENGPAGDPRGTTVDWRGVTGKALPYEIQQPPGPDNVLGTLMLDSPNDFGVYMHDTPNKKLFLSDMRMMSNGCVRVEQIMPLASLVLTGNMMAGEEELTQDIATGQTMHIALPAPLAVYMVYWTASADEDGVAFRPDIYDRDAVLFAHMGTVALPRPAKVAAAVGAPSDADHLTRVR